MLYAREAEIKSLDDLMGTDKQRGTTIPALFNQFGRFIQNPSTVSVETYKRMTDTDDTVGSGVDFLLQCLVARLGRYVHKSTEITEWVNKRLQAIGGGFEPVCKEMFSAAWAGVSVSEKVWANGDDGFVPQEIVTLPPSTVVFETNRQGKITDDGILQYQRNFNPGMLGQGLGFPTFGFQQPYKPDMWAKFGDLPFPMRSSSYYNYLAIRIPKLKAIHYAFNASGSFGNPYGRSLLRRAYNQWISKQAYLQMLAVALDRKGTPLTVVYADPNHTVEDGKTTPANVNTKGMTGNKIRGDVAAREAFRNIHNDTTIILPGKKGQYYDLDFVSQQSNADVFIAAIQMCDRAIMRALLIPSLVFTNGDGTGSYALGEQHARTFDKICDGWVDPLKRCLIDQLVREMVAYNFPESAWKKDGLGDFTKRELGQDEREKEAQVITQAVSVGAIDMTDLNDLNKARESLGYEPRTEVFPPKADAFGLGGLEDDPDNEPSAEQVAAANNAKSAPGASATA